MPSEPAASPPPPSSPQAQVPVEPALGAFARFVRMWWAPGEVFSAIARRPSLAAAGLALAALIAGSTITQVIALSKIDQEAAIRKAITGNPFGAGREPSDEEIEQAVKMGKTFAWIAPAVTLFTLPITFAMIAVFFFLGLKIAGSGAGYPTILETVVLALWPPSLAHAFAFTVVALSRSQLSADGAQTLVPSSAAWFVPGAPGPVRVLLGAFDVFTAWTLLLLVLGLATVGKVRTTRAAAVVLGLFAGWTLLKVGGSALMAALGGMAGG